MTLNRRGHGGVGRLGLWELGGREFLLALSIRGVVVVVFLSYHEIALLGGWALFDWPELAIGGVMVLCQGGS
jgi:hypothetical protein